MARYWRNINGALVELFPRKDFKSPVDGVTYGATYFEDAAWRTTHGVLIETVSGTKPDDRFYTVTESLSLDAVRTYAGTPKALDVIKAEKRVDARQLYWATCSQGVTVVLSGVSVPLKTNHESRQEIKGLVDYLTAHGGTQNAVTRSGYAVSWTVALAQTALDAIDAKIATALAAEFTHVSAINAFTAGQEQALINYAVV